MSAGLARCPSAPGRRLTTPLLVIIALGSTLAGPAACARPAAGHNAGETAARPAPTDVALPIRYDEHRWIVRPVTTAGDTLDLYTDSDYPARRLLVRAADASPMPLGAPTILLGFKNAPGGGDSPWFARLRVAVEGDSLDLLFDTGVTVDYPNRRATFARPAGAKD